MATFKNAFASARKSGKKTFTWQGKSYTTEVRSNQAPAKSQRPKARPSQGSEGFGGGRSSGSGASGSARNSPRPQARGARSLEFSTRKYLEDQKKKK